MELFKVVYNKGIITIELSAESQRNIVSFDRVHFVSLVKVGTIIQQFYNWIDVPSYSNISPEIISGGVRNLFRTMKTREAIQSVLPRYLTISELRSSLPDDGTIMFGNDYGTRRSFQRLSYEDLTRAARTLEGSRAEWTIPDEYSNGINVELSEGYPPTIDEDIR